MSYKKKYEIRKKILGGKIENSKLEDINKKIIIIKIEKKDPADKIKCEICAKEYVRSCKTGHLGTRYHQLGVIEHDKFLKNLRSD